MHRYVISLLLVTTVLQASFIQGGYYWWHALGIFLGIGGAEFAKNGMPLMVDVSGRRLLATVSVLGISLTVLCVFHPGAKAILALL